jgi:hypothetical protein
MAAAGKESDFCRPRPGGVALGKGYWLEARSMGVVSRREPSFHCGGGRAWPPLERPMLAAPLTSERLARKR